MHNFLPFFKNFTKVFFVDLTIRFTITEYTPKIAGRSASDLISVDAKYSSG